MGRFIPEQYERTLKHTRRHQKQAAILAQMLAPPERLLVSTFVAVHFDGSGNDG